MLLLLLLMVTSWANWDLLKRDVKATNMDYVWLTSGANEGRLGTVSGNNAYISIFRLYTSVKVNPSIFVLMIPTIAMISKSREERKNKRIATTLKTARRRR